MDTSLRIGIDRLIDPVVGVGAATADPMFLPSTLRAVAEIDSASPAPPSRVQLPQYGRVGAARDAKSHCTASVILPAFVFSARCGGRVTESSPCCQRRGANPVTYTYSTRHQRPADG